MAIALIISVIANAEIIQSGSCGDNVTYTLDNQGVLSISGSGVMKNYSKYINIPWYSSRSMITKVTIDDGVTSIGDIAFEDCSGLNTIVIPSSVTKIGIDAFFQSNVATVIWNARQLDSSPFGNSKHITEVYFGDSVQTIYPTFAIMPSINKIVIGKNVNYISNDSFKRCTGLTEFYVTGEEVPYLYSDVFSSISLANVTLYVPKDKIDYYKTTAPWMDFGKILNLEGNEPEMPIKEQCAKPTVMVENGKLKFMCETEGAVLHYTISCSDAVSNVTENNIEVNLTKQYIITFFATADGYDKSETVVEAITLGNASTVDVNADGSVDTQDVLEIYEYMKTHAKERKEIDEDED